MEKGGQSISILIFILFFFCLLSLLIFPLTYGQKDSRKTNTVKQSRRNDNKRQKAELIEQKIDELNQVLVERMLLVVKRMEQLNDKIKTRANLTALEGGELEDVFLKIEKEEVGLQDVKRSLNDQKGKRYSIQIDSDRITKESLKKSYQELVSDLNRLRSDLVKIKKEMIVILTMLAQSQESG